jgi:hypothetical protein
VKVSRREIVQPAGWIAVLAVPYIVRWRPQIASRPA